MSRIRPSLILQIGIPDDLACPEVEDELKRSFSFIAPVVPVVRAASEAGEAGAAAPAAVVLPVRMTVRLHRPYWDAGDPAAQQLWVEAMEPWLANMFTKLSGALKAFCGLEHPGLVNPVAFGPLEVCFDEHGAVQVALEPDSSIPAGALDAVRAYRARGSEE